MIFLFIFIMLVIFFYKKHKKAYQTKFKIELSTFYSKKEEEIFCNLIILLTK